MNTIKSKDKNKHFIPFRWPNETAGDGDGAGTWISQLFGEEKGGCDLKTEGSKFSTQVYRRNEMKFYISM